MLKATFVQENQSQSLNPKLEFITSRSYNLNDKYTYPLFFICSLYIINLLYFSSQNLLLSKKLYSDGVSIW